MTFNGSTYMNRKNVEVSIGHGNSRYVLSDLGQELYTFIFCLCKERITTLTSQTYCKTELQNNTRTASTQLLRNNAVYSVQGSYNFIGDLVRVS